MSIEEVKKHYPIGQRCMYYTRIAVVNAYCYDQQGNITTLECWYEGYRGRELKYISPNIRVLRPF